MNVPHWWKKYIYGKIYTLSKVGNVPKLTAQGTEYQQEHAKVSPASFK